MQSLIFSEKLTILCLECRPPQICLALYGLKRNRNSHIDTHAWRSPETHLNQYEIKI